MVLVLSIFKPAPMAASMPSRGHAARMTGHTEKSRGRRRFPPLRVLAPGAGPCGLLAGCAREKSWGVPPLFRWALGGSLPLLGLPPACRVTGFGHSWRQLLAAGSSERNGNDRRTLMPGRVRSCGRMQRAANAIRAAGWQAWDGREGKIKSATGQREKPVSGSLARRISKTALRVNSWSPNAGLRRVEQRAG
jgi:hypothetical protein